jgi:hypothetical protein
MQSTHTMSFQRRNPSRPSEQPWPPDAGSAVPRSLRVAALSVLAGAFIVLCWRLWLASRGTDFFSDDAYYYAVIARNVVRTGRLTFDGVTLTNGFHPLLLWLEAAGFALFGTSAAPAVQYLVLNMSMAAIFLATFIICLVLGFRVRPSEENRPLQPALVIVFSALLVPRFTSLYLDGMESILELPLLALLGVPVWRSRWVAAGWCGALLGLARLDTIPFLLVPLTLVCTWREWRSGRPPLRVALWMMLPAGLCTATLMLANLRFFGSPMPISGTLKSTFPLIHPQLRNLFGNADERLGLRLSVLGALAGLLLLARTGKVGRALRGGGLLAGALALVQVVALALFQRWVKPTPSWYLASILPLGTLAGALGVANVLSFHWLRRGSALVAAGALALNLAWMAGVAGRLGTPTAASLPSARDDGGAMQGLLRFIDSQPAERIWAASDCGKPAFWSRRPFVNLDGLVNDFRYQEILRDQRLGSYLKERRVRYLIFGAWNASAEGWGGTDEPVYRHRVAPAVFSGEYQVAEYYLYSYRYSKYSDCLRLPRSAEVWRSSAIADGPVMARLVVFDLDTVWADSTHERSQEQRATPP